MFSVDLDRANRLDLLGKRLGLKRPQIALMALALGEKILEGLSDSEAPKDLLGKSSTAQKTSVASEAKPSHLRDTSGARSSQQPSRKKSSSSPPPALTKIGETSGGQSVLMRSSPAKASAEPALALAPSGSESPANGQPEPEEVVIRDNPFEALT